MNILWILASQFFVLSLIAVGGASATLPEMNRIFVDQLHLMSSTEFNHLFALSQAAPGPNVLFVALFGLHMAGISGALVSMLAMCGPTIIISIAVERFGSRYHDAKIYVALRQSLIPISIGLLMSTAILLMRAAPNLFSLPMTLICVVVLLKTKIHPLWLIACGGILGALGAF